MIFYTIDTQFYTVMNDQKLIKIVNLDNDLSSVEDDQGFTVSMGARARYSRDCSI